MRNDKTLGEAKQWLRDKMNDKGARCPCCRQFAKIYHRRIHSSMARTLIKLYRYKGTDWQHLPTSRKTLGITSRDDVSLAYWGLIEEAVEPREDGGRAGWWRVTVKGESFITRNLKVPKHAYVFDATFLKFDSKTDLVGIEDCLGESFDYNELMNS